MFDRLIGVLTLNAPKYREIAKATDATRQAAIIVFVVAALTGLANGLLSHRTSDLVIFEVVESLLFALLGWPFASWLLAWVSTNLFSGKTNTTEMLRVVGYADVFNLVQIIPTKESLYPSSAVVIVSIVVLIIFVCRVLYLIAFVVGIREASNFSTGRAVGTLIVTAVIGAIILFALVMVVELLVGMIG